MKKVSDNIKQMHINKLKEEHKLWSYDQESVKDLPNDILIEKVLVYLDLDEIDLLPVELRKAHQNNDRAVMQAYGFPIKDFNESDCVAKLLEMYKELIEKNSTK